MKLKKFFLVLALLALTATTPALAAENITVNTDMSILVNYSLFVPSNSNGEQVMVMEYNGTTYAPLRALAEAYGLTVGYNDEQRLVTVDYVDGVDPKTTAPTTEKDFNKSLTITVNTDVSVLVNGSVFEPKNADGDPVLIFEYQGTTYAPLRALAEAYDLDVTYDQAQRMAAVTQFYDVLRAVDGDTIEINYHGKAEKVRLIGVDAPESVHPDASKNTEAGKTASEYTSSKLSGKKVGLEFDVQQRDMYGRLLAYVYLDGKMFNKTLLEEGYANMATYPPNVKYVSDFQAIVKERSEKLGQAQPQETAKPDNTHSPASGNEVYITKTGKKYHYDGNCGNGTYYLTTLEDALRLGLEPCEKCVR